jgi:hypothetical protein
MSNDELKLELAKLHEKLDRVLAILDAKAVAAQRKLAERRSRQEKPLPLTEDEIKQQQERFQKLFYRWMGGFELEVQTELEAADADALRRFADANNLNITTHCRSISRETSTDAGPGFTAGRGRLIPRSSGAGILGTRFQRNLKATNGRFESKAV